jgi:putative DNA primase/helicase
MDFRQFAEQHGLIIDHVLLDKWVRCPTTDKPRSKNGAYIWDGKRGAIQNWAIHEKPIPFLSNEFSYTDPEWRKKKAKADEARALRQNKAILKASSMLDNAIKAKHPYMEKKGFPDDKQWVYEGLLIIPMRIDQRLVGCQTISADGTKKFLYGQITKGAETIIDNKGVHILCEGFATGLSIRRSLKAIKKRYTIHICFSASNIIQMAEKYNNCVIVADNDSVGLKTAIKTGRPYWVSDLEGEDANDYEKRNGSVALGLSIIASFQGVEL